MDKFRVYTKLKKMGDDYFEMTYKEYTNDGKFVCTGTEDFSGTRLKTATKKYLVYVHNGRENRAGGKMTDCVGAIRMSQNAVAIKTAKMFYENVARVERR